MLRCISIHVLREEDDQAARGQRHRSGISIHVLREEDDVRQGPLTLNGPIFLSTSSARRTTIPQNRGGGGVAISIHVLREEDDELLVRAARIIFGEFLSTSSARRTT